MACLCALTVKQMCKQIFHSIEQNKYYKGKWHERKCVDCSNRDIVCWIEVNSTENIIKGQDERDHEKNRVQNCPSLKSKEIIKT